MKSSLELLIRIERLLSNLGSTGEHLDEVSREMLLHISEAEIHQREVRVSTLCRDERFGSFPTAHRRLKRLIEMGLIQSAADPSDARVLVLSMTAKTKKNIRHAARQIRQTSARGA